MNKRVIIVVIVRSHMLFARFMGMVIVVATSECPGMGCSGLLLLLEAAAVGLRRRLAPDLAHRAVARLLG
jgi:hypothetical protein